MEQGKAEIDYKRAQTVKTLADADAVNMQTGDLAMQMAGPPIMMPPIMPMGAMPPPGGPMNDNMGEPMPPPGMPPDDPMQPPMPGGLPVDPNIASMLPPA